MQVSAEKNRENYSPKVDHRRELEQKLEVEEQGGQDEIAGSTSAGPTDGQGRADVGAADLGGQKHEGEEVLASTKKY